MSRARQVAEVVTRALAERPETVRVTEVEHRGVTLIELFAEPGDVGRIIGRQGRTVAALRTLVAATAEREGKRVTIEIHESTRSTESTQPPAGSP